jgi:mannose-6-phosphate isomerase-like protein (cupin superfamily)
MFSFLAQHPLHTNTASLNPITYEDGRSSQIFFNPSAKYMVRHTIFATTTKKGRSFFNPPMHFHMYQTEEFQVVSGVARFALDGEKIMRNAGEIQVIPKGRYHCFENASESGEDLVIDLRLDQQVWEMEERFFRNFFGYLEDCHKAKQSPSLFQILLFLHTVDGPLAIPVPGPAWLGRQISWVFMVVLGVVVGEWLLGYSGTYSAYYTDDKDK